MLAALRNSFDDTGCRVDIELAASKVVEEKERFRALNQNVIHAHRDEVDANRVVAPELESQFQFGSHTVGAGNEDRLAVTAGQLEQRTEAAQPPKNTFTQGFAGKWLDTFDQCIASTDINARITVGERWLDLLRHLLFVPIQACKVAEVVKCAIPSEKVGILSEIAATRAALAEVCCTFPMRQLILDLLPETQPRLDSYVVGGNGEAVTGLAAWLNPDSAESSLFLWGESGSGKTHLLRACAGRYKDAASDPDLAGMPSASGGNSNGSLQMYAIDNVDALSGSGQITLFNLFNRLVDSGGRLITAARKPPLGLELREDLRTRLGSGLIYRLQPLSDGEKIAALSALAELRGLRLPNGALDYLLARAPRDMGSLTAYLVALDRYSLEHKRAITMPLLREAFEYCKAL